MASSQVVVDQDHPPDPVSSDNPLQFLMHHGFFYKNNAEIGKLVDDLYENKRANEATLDYFIPKMKEDIRLKCLLDEYPIEMLNFSRPWGKTMAPYKWSKKSTPKSKDVITAYFLGSNPQYYCWAGSHKLEYDGTLSSDYGIRSIPEDSLGSYLKMKLDLTDGGVLFVQHLLVHKAEGSAIMVSLLKPPDSASKSLQ